MEELAARQDKNFALNSLCSLMMLWYIFCESSYYDTLKKDFFSCKISNLVFRSL